MLVRKVAGVFGGANIFSASDMKYQSERSDQMPGQAGWDDWTGVRQNEERDAGLFRSPTGFSWRAQSPIEVPFRTGIAILPTSTGFSWRRQGPVGSRNWTYSPVLASRQDPAIGARVLSDKQADNHSRPGGI